MYCHRALNILCSINALDVIVLKERMHTYITLEYIQKKVYSTRNHSLSLSMYAWLSKSGIFAVLRN